MATRPDIILGTRIANPAEAIYRGTTQGGEMFATRRGIQQNRMLDEYGPGIYAGNEQALQQLARFDPAGALTIKRQHAAERRAQAAAARAAAASRRAAAAAAQDASKREELAREVQLLRGVALARENGEEAFMQALNTSGLAQEGVTPQNFDMFLMTGEGAVRELGEAVQDLRPEPYEPDYERVGNRFVDMNRPMSGAQPIPGLPGETKSREIRNDQNGVPRYVDTGEPVYPGVAPVREPSAKEVEINALTSNLQSRGMTFEEARRRAEGIAYGMFEPLESGGLLDLGTGQIEGAQLVPQEDIPQVQGGQDGGLFSRAGQATGVLPALGRASSDTLGQISGLFYFEEPVRAGQAFTAGTGELIRALSINPRFPVAEMERIRREIQIDPGVFRSPAAMQDRMREVDAYLVRRMNAEARVANSAGVPMEDRQNAASAFRNMQRFRDLMAVPPEDLPAPTTREEYDRLPPGSQYIHPDGDIRTKS